MPSLLNCPVLFVTSVDVPQSAWIVGVVELFEVVQSLNVAGVAALLEMVIERESGAAYAVLIEAINTSNIEYI